MGSQRGSQHPFSVTAQDPRVWLHKHISWEQGNYIRYLFSHAVCVGVAHFPVEGLLDSAFLRQWNALALWSLGPRCLSGLQENGLLLICGSPIPIPLKRILCEECLVGVRTQYPGVNGTCVWLRLLCMFGGLRASPGERCPTCTQKAYSEGCQRGYFFIVWEPSRRTFMLQGSVTK
ncbi:interleukin-17F-like [Platysternon megacephalum]|uniref:Interleukin-17F-like n=1 Tax=Platysternon megacephalum TaxID=55544 RepID=A0A4D9ESU2_9SAUR|nr:interleukin-17F-like [Platysternon megacephalum]